MTPERNAIPRAYPYSVFVVFQQCGHIAGTNTIGCGVPLEFPGLSVEAVQTTDERADPNIMVGVFQQRPAVVVRNGFAIRGIISIVCKPLSIKTVNAAEVSSNP